MNRSINCSDPFYTDRVISPVGAVALHVPFAAVGLIGNGFVFLLFVRLPKLRLNTTNIFLFNLAIADFLSSVFMAARPYVFDLDPDSLPWSEFVCRFFKSDFPLWTCVTASVYNLFLVTVDRYLCVLKPTLYRRHFTPRRIRLMVGSCWFFSAVLETFCFYSTRINACGACEIYWSSLALQIICGLGVFLTTYLLPIVTILFAYGNIIRTLKQREAALESQRQRAAAANLLRTRRNIVVMLQVLVLMFAVLWAPNQIIFLLLSFPGVSFDGIRQVGYTIILVVGFANCIINPLVYTLSNKRLRKSFVTVLLCRSGIVIDPGTDNSPSANLPASASLDGPPVHPRGRHVFDTTTFVSRRETNFVSGRQISRAGKS